MTHQQSLEIARVAERPALSMVAKIDTEGSEWSTMEAMTDEHFMQFAILDLEIHWCMPRHGEEMGQTLKRKIERQMARMHKMFYVADRFADKPAVYEKAGCFHPNVAGSDVMMSVSYVNKAFVHKLMEEEGGQQ